MVHRSLVGVSGWIVGVFLVFGCAGKPVIDSGNEASAGSGSADNGKGGTGAKSSVVGLEEGGNNGTVDKTSTCRTTCDTDECGPVSNGCGSFIECGGCTDPEICGGAGIASRCGTLTSTCVPKTCVEQGFSCGLQSDGCGGIIDCWSNEAKAQTPPACTGLGEACVEGTCTYVAATCTPKTCKDIANSDSLCGPVSDDCGSTLDCGFTCPSTQVCGAYKPGVCAEVKCEPLTCEVARRPLPPGFCGIVPDGCGGIIANCATTCTGTDTCGGAGVPDVCGTGTTACVPLNAAAACGTTCGQVSDGCGGLVTCATCTLPQTCGGGGDPGVCGAPACQPLTCIVLNAECDTIADGCGGTVACGSCSGTETCGGGGDPNRCGAAVCVPRTQTEVCTVGMCGVQSDGCSGTVNCGGCTSPNTCGGGGTPSVCGAPACTKRTCASVGANCGPISDGCGGIIASCGDCAGTDTCGGVKPSVCGTAVDPDCTGFCPNIDWTCGSGNETRLTGKVYAPNGSQALYNALVYVPNAPLPNINAGATCERCEDEKLGNPIAAALTGPDGAFVLKNVPAGVSFPLVVKMGKWRRVVTIPAVTKCTNVNLTVEQTRLPKSMTDATAENLAYVNIPHFAIVTGAVDAIECVMRKIGVSDTEFTLPTGTGRIHMYRANGGTMGCKKFRTGSTTRCASSNDADVTQAKLDTLFSGTKLNEYDIGVFDCEGGANEHNTLDTKLREWANVGGRVFASHYSYTYLHDNGDFASTATWNGTENGNSSTTGIIDKSSPKGQALNTWLGNVGAWSPTYGDGYIAITDPRDYVKTAAASSERFIYTDTSVRINNTQISDATAVQQYSFNTPWGANESSICGRVLYSAFHVAGASGLGDDVFPSYCSTGALTAQEKVLMFMIFDLSACVSVGDPPQPPTCTPATCGEMEANCGYVADGCGGLLDCGTCTSNNSCGGGGFANQCGNSCTRTTCGAQGANCGIIADGCGGTLECGSCTSPAICGGGGTSNVCGSPVCTPRSCADVGAQCGAISDGCGGTVECGTCTSPSVCGGGGTPNLCGAGTCTPNSCGTAKCGFVGDGCGGTVACGTCSAGQTCVAGACTGGTCTPRTCSAVSAECGFIGDGCGGTLNCGACSAPSVCGGGGVPSQCGGTCTPRSCSSVGAECGAVSDGCGSVLSCGVCVSPEVCGGAGVANQCGAGTCVPAACSAAVNCGSIGDGCGGVVNCGICPAGQSCGGAGVPNQCGAGGCVPRTCAEQNANCGPAADGCGNLLDCGTCVLPDTCGGGGTPSRCGNMGGPTT